MVKEAIFFVFCVLSFLAIVNCRELRRGDECYVPEAETGCQVTREGDTVCGSNGCTYDNDDALGCVQKLRPEVKEEKCTVSHSETGRINGIVDISKSFKPSSHPDCDVKAKDNHCNIIKNEPKICASNGCLYNDSEFHCARKNKKDLKKGSCASKPSDFGSINGRAADSQAKPLSEPKRAPHPDCYVPVQCVKKDDDEPKVCGNNGCYYNSLSELRCVRIEDNNTNLSDLSVNDHCEELKKN